MASYQAQGHDPIRIRAGYLGSLTKCFKRVSEIVSKSAPIEQAIELQDKLAKRYNEYLETHEWCLASVPDRQDELMGSHDKYCQQLQVVSKQLQEYISYVSHLLTADDAQSVHSVSSPPSTIPAVGQFLRTPSRRSSASGHTSRAPSKSHRPSQVSSSRSERLIEARVQAELAKKRIDQLKSVQEMKRRKQAIDDEIEMSEREHKLQELTTEIDIRLREEVRDALGSDYESDDEREDVTLAAQQTQKATTAPAVLPASKTVTMADVGGKEVPPAKPHPLSTLNPAAKSYKPQFRQTLEEQQEDMKRILGDPSFRYAKVDRADLPDAYASGYRAPMNTPKFEVNEGYHPPSFDLRQERRTLSPPRSRFQPPFDFRQDRRAVSPPRHFDQAASDAVTTTKDNSVSPIDKLSQALLEVHLPRPEQQTFDGSAKDYKAFISSFKMNIAEKITDNSLKLVYLIQHCTGDAKKLVKDCVLLDPSVGYDTALSKLEKRFGQSHLIARSYIDDITGGPQVKANDVNALVSLSDDMSNCQTVLSQLKFTSDLDASGTLRNIVKRLPNHIQSKWVEKVSDIIEKGREPTFDDLASFVEIRARVASSMYGRDYATANKTKSQPQEQKTTKQKPTKTHVTTMNTSTEKPPAKPQEKKEAKAKPSSTQSSSATSSDKSDRPSCVFCDTPGHGIERCFKFKKLSVDERVEAVKKNHLCFCCLKSGHGSRNCDKSCSKCQRRHHVLLHDPKRESKKPDDKPQTDQTAPKKEVTTASTSKFKSQASFGALPVRLESGGTSVRTFALIDSGSNTTLVCRSLVDHLGIKGTKSPFLVNTLAGPAVHEEQMSCKLTLFSDDRQESVDVEALTVPAIPINTNSRVKPSDWAHLHDLNLCSEQGPVEILIGTDCPEVFWSLEERRGDRKEPMARRTLLGWIVLGPTSSSHDVHLTQSDPLQLQLERIWMNDFQDVRTTEPVMSVDDKTALKHMKDTVAIVDGKYQVGIPWRVDPSSSLPNNRSVAESRLRMLKRKFQADPQIAADYTKTVEAYISDNQARLVTAEEASSDNQWFLPHHAVFKKSNPSKCRVVFDCAAQYKGVSLNDVIHQGPNFMNNLAGVLIRFRKEPVAVIGDIKLMFHQCFVLPEDQRFLRFLWWPNGDTSQPAQVHAMKVHLFGGKSSPSVVNFCMRKTADDNESAFSEVAIDTLRRSFYVDDMIRSVDSVDVAKQLIPDMKDLLAKGGFVLAKFMSTHRDVIDSIPEEDRAKSLQELSIEDATLPQESALGLQWNVEGDYFTYTVNLQDRPHTRRGLLATTASLYDPLGLIAPVLLVPKLVQQDLCRLQFDWDDEMPDDKRNVVDHWKAATSNLSSIQVPRCFQKGPSSLSDRELHVFCDASESAYGCVAYLKVTSDDGVFVSLVMGKSRVAPIKTISIPRLELTAATLAAKMSKFLFTEFDFDELPMYFWSDSMTVLRYIRNVSTRFKVFVAHRVQQIQDLTDVATWNYVPTDLNPADLASRGINPDDSTKIQFWLNGPDFLKNNTSYDRLFEEPFAEDQELEVRVSCLAETVVDLDVFIQHFSSLRRLCRSVCWLSKFCEVLRGKAPTKSLTVQDVDTALTSLIKYTQARCFPKEIKALREGRPLPKSSPILQLNPVLHDDVVCVGGRLQAAPDDVSKHPIILPRHHLTTLIIRSAHELNGHVGTNHTLSIVRRRFYPLRGYSQVKSIIKDCVQCKRHHGKPLEQKMADLPAERVAISDPPFTYVGVDYFGPMNVKFRRGSTKRYGCLFTCLVTRAVHIEIAHKLDSDSFLMALNRFIARRGKPQKIFSDNGTNFVAANKELADEIANINSKKLEEQMLVEAIEWSFNPPHAPHMGGVWERLIRSVKSILKHLVQDRLLTDEELLSFMCETEKILNDRPLTRIGEDPRDDTPLTPNHLLLLRDNSCQPVTEANHVRRRWQVIQNIANKFFSRFVSEYIPELQLRQKWRDTKENLKVDDVVLVVEDDSPRGQWPLGLVEAVELSKDGLVRAADVRVKNKVKRRPINKLVLLEHHE